MSKTVEVIQALTGFVKAFFEGFGVFEFILAVIVILALFAWLNPGGLVALGAAIRDVLPSIPIPKGG